MIYLDNAATTYPKPEEVYKRVDDVMRNYGANPGRAGHKMALDAGRVIYSARATISAFFNIKNPMDLVFTANATEALNIAIKGLLDDGDHVITSSIEHNSVLRPIKALEDSGLIKSTILECNSEGKLQAEQVKDAIRKNTRAIVISHGSNVIGSILPIEEIGKIAREAGIILIVDSAQTAGTIPIDAEKLNIDILIFAGHKSLMGPLGSGGLYIKEGLKLKTIIEGGTGSRSESAIQPEMMPDRFESGTPNTPAIAGLEMGVKYIQKKGIANIRAYERELTKQFIEGLRKIENVKIYGPKDIEERTSVVSINIGDEDSSEVAYILDEEFDIGVRPGLHCAPLAHKTIGTFEQGTVRFSIGQYNTREEIEKAIEAVKIIAKRVK